MAATNFAGRSVLLLESRRATELAALITTFGGRPVSAPALQEVPLEANTGVADFARAVISDQFDCVILLTGVGTRLMLGVIERAGLREPFVEALRRTRVVARGPKPMAVLRELQVPAWFAAPEPNTWRELIRTFDARADAFSLAGASVAVQEYGVSNDDLLKALQTRQARVTTIPVYQWALPDDTAPLQAGIEAICRREIDVLIVTSGIQIAHLWQVAGAAGRADDLRAQLASHVMIASIGPTSSEVLRSYDLEPDLEASHPRMGVLVTEAAAQSGALLERKRSSAQAVSPNP
jgi:uroporphyrinogen-III synthase